MNEHVLRWNRSICSLTAHSMSQWKPHFSFPFYQAMVHLPEPVSIKSASWTYCTQIIWLEISQTCFRFFVKEPLTLFISILKCLAVLEFSGDKWIIRWFSNPASNWRNSLIGEKCFGSALHVFLSSQAFLKYHKTQNGNFSNQIFFMYDVFHWEWIQKNII